MTANDRQAWLILVVTVVIAVGATAGVLALRQRADNSRQTQILVAELEASVNLSARLEWEAVAEREVNPRLSKDIRGTHIRIDQTLNRLSQLHPRSRDVKQLRRTYLAYTSASRQEMGLLAARGFEEAERFHRQRVDPAFDVLRKTLARENRAHSEEAKRNIALANLGSAATVVGALVAVSLLLLNLQRRERAAQAEAAEETQHNLAIQSALNSVLRLTIEDMPLEQVFEQSLEMILSVPSLAFESKGAVFVVEDASDRLVMKAQRGVADPIRESCRIVPFGKCLCGRAAATRETQFSERLDDRHDTTYEGIVPHGHYCTPIVSAGRTLGVLNVYTKEGHRRDPAEEAFLAAVCDALAGALMRRESDETLRGERHLLDQIMQSSPVGIYVTDLKGRIILANPQARELIGLTEEGIAKRAHNVLDTQVTDYESRTFPDDKRPFAQLMTTGKQVVAAGYAIERPDGERVMLAESAAPLLDPKGRIGSVVFTVRNVTDRIEAERALRQTERALRAITRCNETLIHATEESSLLEEICDLVVGVGGYLLASADLVDPVRDLDRSVSDGRVTRSDADVTELTWSDIAGGRSPAEESMTTGVPCVVRNALADVILDERHEEAIRHGYASSMTLPLIAGGLVFGTLTIYSAARATFEGEEVPLLVELANDLAYGIMSLRTRIERERAQAALEDSEQRYRRLVESSPDAIAVHVAGEIIYANIAAATILRAGSPNDLIGCQVLDFLPPEYRKSGKDALRRPKGADARGRTSELVFMRLDGTHVDVELAAIPSTYEGRPATQVVFRDITERKQVDVLKSDFISMVSHELRTPLAVILGNADLIDRLSEQPPDRAALAKATGKIRERVTLMTRLVDNLLQVARTGVGDLVPNPQTVDLSELISDSARSVAMTSRHELELDIAPNLGASSCDPTQISMAIMNLVSNAVKFSPKGGNIRVGARGKASRLRIGVSDEGVGIAPHDLPHIFDRFFQADMSATRAFGGVGMGLYIARQIVEAHGGRIDVESTPGKGSTFTIEIPMAEREAAA